MGKTKKSFALIFGLIITAGLAILGSGVVTRTLSENRVAHENIESIQAFWLAEAGVQRAFLAARNNDWDGWSSDAGGNKSFNANLANTGGAYSIAISGLSTNSPTISSTGTISGITNQSRLLQATLRRQSPFTSAVFGKNSVSLSGNARTDSYNSAAGSYGAGNVGANGDVATNAHTAGAITLTGNARINGDANTGSDGTITLTGNARVTGNITDTSNINLSAVIVPESLTGLSSAGNISVGGNNSVTLAGGDYKYSSISVSGNGRLTINGDTNIYLTNASSLSVSGNGRLVVNGSLKIYADGNCLVSGNGIANSTLLAQNFILYGTNTATAIQVSGNGDLYGAIYAPAANINLNGNGAVYGSLVGATVDLSGNAGLHYDEALQGFSGFGNYVLKDWQESQNPYPLTP
jgi:Tfp pilus assembly protein PilX/cytoskeletal protein CcmA (bactofilin family)